MPLNYTSMEQVSGWRFLRHRQAVAIARHSVRLVHDPSRNATASLLVGAVASVLIVGVCFIVAFFRPAGMVGQEPILADRATGGLYVRVGDTVHPALNLASARLIAGTDANPTMVPISEIKKLPMGPLVGIPGAPDDLVVATPTDAGFGLCDHLGSTGSRAVPTVTVLMGTPDLDKWAHPVTSPESVLATYGGHTYLVTDGHRSQIDLADKAVTLALGIPAGTLQPAPLSRALYEALIPTGPLRVPDVPNPGGPVGYGTPALPVVSGSVIKVTDATGEPNFFVALPAGVQRIPETVALILSNANLSRQPVVDSDPATIAGLPQAVGFDAAMYPKGPLTLLDKAAEPVTCVLWQKGSGDSQAVVSTVSGKRLPIPVGDEARVVTLVSGPDRGAASSVYLGADAANFVQVTGVEPDSARRESLWWVSSSGVRFGVPSQGGDESRTRDALGLTASPVPAPWSVIRWLPAGPTLSYAAAMSQHDTLIPDTPAKVLDKQGG